MQEEAKGLVFSPPVNLEVFIEGEDVRGFEMVGEADEAGVGEIDFAIAVFAELAAKFGGILGELVGNRKVAGGDVFDDGFRRTAEIAQQVTSFRDYRFACDQRRLQRLHDFGAGGMKLFISIQQGDDYAGIEKDRFHRPKFRKCFLLEPRSETPEENLPRPMIAALFRRK